MEFSSIPKNPGHPSHPHESRRSAIGYTAVVMEPFRLACETFPVFGNLGVPLATVDIGSVGVVTVATNRYLDYWREMAMSAEDHLFVDRAVVMHVFTDRAADVKTMKNDFHRVTINPIAIDPLGWPGATLERYALIDQYSAYLQQDLLVHLDADMRIVVDVGGELDPGDWPGGIALVEHPGYRRPRWSQRVPLYVRRPRLLARDVLSQVRSGAVGMWEQRPESRAYVPRAGRRTYVCGGTWMGLREPFLAMAHELAERTEADKRDAITAVWHDESHLNWYASRYPSAVLASEYCYAPGFANLAGLAPRIIAVDKGDDRTR